MSYRQSRYVPVLQAIGQPRRPYNWVQWIGFALKVLGVAWLMACLAQGLGLVEMGKPDFGWGLLLTIVGDLLIYSRREDYVPPDDMQRRRDISRGAVAAIIGGNGLLVLFALPADR